MVAMKAYDAPKLLAEERQASPEMEYATVTILIRAGVRLERAVVHLKPTGTLP
jgi:hypothetical protein